MDWLRSRMQYHPITPLWWCSIGCFRGLSVAMWSLLIDTKVACSCTEGKAEPGRYASLPQALSQRRPHHSPESPLGQQAGGPDRGGLCASAAHAREANRDVLYANVKEDSTTRTQAERVREGVVSLLRSGEQGTEPSLWSDNSVFTLPVRHFLTGSTKDSDWLSW